MHNDSVVATVVASARLKPNLESATAAVALQMILRKQQIAAKMNFILVDADSPVSETTHRMPG